MIPEFHTTLDAVAATMDAWRRGKSSSLIEYTQPTRVEPVVLLEQSLAEEKYARDLLLALNNIYAGYYLQAVAISTNVGSVDVIKLLDKLSTKRSKSDNAVRSALKITTESYQAQLPDYTALQNDEEYSISMLSREDKSRRQRFGSRTVENAYDLQDLSVGKLLELNIQSDGNEATIPVAIRLMTHAIRTASMAAVLTNIAKDKAPEIRYHGLRSGALRAFSDGLLCQDLIDNHRKVLRADDTGTVADMLKSRQSNRIAGLVGLDPSVNIDSSIAVLSRNTAMVVKREMGRGLDDYRTREDVMGSLGLMLMAVVDTEDEVLTIYHRGINDTTEVRLSHLSKSKVQGSDITEILQQYQASRAPTF